MSGNGDEEKLSSERSQASVVARAEKRALVRMAERLPRWVSPDLLTFVGLAGLAGAGLCYYLSGRHFGYLIAASAGLVVNWFGDSLDGTLARVRNMQRPKYGYYLDHLVDAFGTVFLLLGVAYSGLMTPIFGIVVLALYLIMSINVYLATHTMGVFKISHAGVSPTEGRILLIGLNTLLIFIQRVTIRSWQVKILDVVAGLVAAALIVLILRSAVRNLTALDRAERAAWDQPEDQEDA